MDRAIAEGQWQAMMPAVFPLILGADLPGVVEAVSEGTSRFSPGEELFGQLLIPPAVLPLRNRCASAPKGPPTCSRATYGRPQGPEGGRGRITAGVVDLPHR
jgi:D-arabinose 1-dehydrogenase-like Zn-dependent alcohol dehydrogenase